MFGAEAPSQVSQMTSNKKGLLFPPQIYLCTWISATNSRLPTPQHFLSSPTDDTPDLILVSISMPLHQSSLHRQPPFICKRIQHSVYKRKISRGWGYGVIIRVRLHVWSILAFCMSISISHLDVLLMAKSYRGMLLCSYFNILGVSIAAHRYPLAYIHMQNGYFIILNDLSHERPLHLFAQ